MANNKISDSIDQTAFQALEDALQTGAYDGKPDKKAGNLVHKPEAKVSDQRKQRAEDQQRLAEQQRQAAENTPRSPVLEAANDRNRRTPAAIMKSLEGAPMGAAMRNAALASVIWIAAAAVLAWFVYGDTLWNASSVGEFLQTPGMIMTLIGMAVPIFLFFAFASMMARAHELRTAARSMAEVALRLAEPETIASERIMSVGQAVRREVSAMNDGIERTIARATELETLVHSEVNALERSYTDNEMRVRGLVHELSSEREAIVTDRKSVV